MKRWVALSTGFTAVVVGMDAVLVAPVIERSYAMFASVLHVDSVRVDRCRDLSCRPTSQATARCVTSPQAEHDNAFGARHLEENARQP